MGSNEYVCADCGNEQDTMDACRKCKSIRVILLSVAAAIGGPDWREVFVADGGLNDTD